MANYHQFLLGDPGTVPFAEWRLPTDESLVLGEGEQLLVVTGAYAAPIEVRLEQSDAAPAPLGPEWEDVVELSVRCAAGIQLAELMGGPRGEVISEPGWHRLRIGARGRDAGEQRGEVGARAKVLERFVIQAWPAPAADGVTLKATSLRPVDHTAGRVHLGAAREAAVRITTDLAQAGGHRNLSGLTGALDVQWTYRTTRRKLFRYAALPNLWTSASGSETSTTPKTGAWYRLSGNPYRDIWDGIPTGADGTWIEGTLLEVDQPTSAVTRWEWVTRPHYGHGRLVQSTTVSIRLDQRSGPDTKPLTTLHLHHDELPIEWLEDMRLCWLCKLEAGDTVFHLAG